MAKLSVVIICFNEEAILEKCLSAVQWADEIVVLDSFSTDRTLEIARQYATQIHQHEWQGFARQKTLALTHASHPWILSLDADEVVSPELAEEIQALLAQGPALAGYRIPRRAFYLGRFLHHCWYPDFKVRLFQRARGRWSDQDVHETVLLDGPCGRLKHPLLHYSFPSIQAHLSTMQEYTSLGAASLARAGRSFSLARLLGSPLFMFLQQYVAKRGFLDGVPGLVASALSAFHEFVKYAKLYELTK
jgi:cellulose synthase/poly-beta-1,6-N-acetylglucosamine synthase-like glycosyltransferase